MSHVVSYRELISSNFGYRHRFSIWHKLFVSMLSLTKTNIRRAIVGELNTYQKRYTRPDKLSNKFFALGWW